MADNRKQSDEFERIAPAAWQPGHEPASTPAAGRGVPAGAVVLAVAAPLYLVARGASRTRTPDEVAVGAT